MTDKTEQLAHLGSSTQPLHHEQGGVITWIHNMHVLMQHTRLHVHKGLWKHKHSCCKRETLLRWFTARLYHNRHLLHDLLNLVSVFVQWGGFNLFKDMSSLFQDWCSIALFGLVCCYNRGPRSIWPSLLQSRRSFITVSPLFASSAQNQGW